MHAASSQLQSVIKPTESSAVNNRPHGLMDDSLYVVIRSREILKMSVMVSQESLLTPKEYNNLLEKKQQTFI